MSAFRKAMGSFPTGVAIVTVACDDGTMYGVTVSSFTSVSLDPLLVLVCLNECGVWSQDFLDNFGSPHR